MAFILADRIRETTEVVGNTTTVLLIGAVDGYRRFSEAVAINDTFNYVIQSAGAEWELGRGTMLSATQFARTPLLSDQGEETLSSLPAGVKDVFLVATAAGSYTRKDGDTMTGPLILFGAPTADLHAATKTYVDLVAGPRLRTVPITTDTPTTSDINGLISYTSTDPVTITADDLGLGATYRVAQLGDGPLTIAAGTGVNLLSDKTVPSFTTAARGAVLTVVSDGAGTVLVSGNTAGAGGGVPSGSYSGTLAIGAAPASYQVLQRATRTGGAFSKGNGVVTLGLTPSVAVTTLEYRLRDFDVSTTTLVDWTSAASALPAGAQTVALSLPAHNKWYALDLRPNGDDTKTVSLTARFGVGEVIALYGQDLAQDAITPTNNDTTTTLASLSITPSLYGAIYAITSTAAGVLSNNPPSWAPPADATFYKSAFAAELLNRAVTSSTVCCGIIGMGKIATTLANLSSPATAYTTFTGLLTSGTVCGKGFGTLMLTHGHDDAKAGTSAATYASQLTTLVNALATAFPGVSFKTLVASIPSVVDITYITDLLSINAIRQGALNYVAANTATALFIPTFDCTLHTDNWRLTQAGQRTQARHFARGFANAIGAATNADLGPSIVSADRAASSAAVVLTMAQSSGTAFQTGVGTLTSLFKVYEAGTTLSPLTISSAVLTNATTITLTLSAAPADDMALDIYYRRPYDTATSAASAIYDNNTADAIGTTGRLLALTTTAAVVCDAPGSVAFAPSALGTVLVYATDTNSTASAPDDGTGKVQFLRHLYDSAKFLQQPTAANRPQIVTNSGASGTKRVLTLGNNRFLRGNGTGFNALINLFNGAMASTTGTICLAVQLVTDDLAWSEPWVFPAADGSQWFHLHHRGTGDLRFRVHDAASVEGNATDTTTTRTGWFCVTCIKNGTSVIIRVDGTQMASATYGGSASFTAGDFLMNATMVPPDGALLSDGGDNNTVAIGGMVVTSTALGGTDLSNVEDWVKATVGLP